MKLRLTCLFFLTSFTLLPAQTALDGAWAKLRSQPGVTQVKEAVTDIETLINSNSGADKGELENILNYAGYLANTMREYALAAHCYELLYTKAITSNSSVTLLVAMNLTDDLEFYPPSDIHLYESRLKKAAGYFDEYLKNHPDNFEVHFNRGVLYYNYIAFIQSHKIYDYDRNINAAVIAHTSLEKAVAIRPDDQDAKDLLHSIKLILGEGGSSSINFNEGK